MQISPFFWLLQGKNQATLDQDLHFPLLEGKIHGMQIGGVTNG
jgi:hypothetical protein